MQAVEFGLEIFEEFLAVRALALLLAFLLPGFLTACGKRGPPSPPGPANQVTYPKVYPTE